MGIWGCLFIVLLWLAVMGLYRLLDPHPNACIGTAVTFGLLFLMAWLGDWKQPGKLPPRDGKY